MSKRLPNSRSPNECGLPNHQFRKSTKKNSSLLLDDTWQNYDRERDEPSDDEYSDYTHMLHQQPRLHQPQPHPPHNTGQRLFTAMSDPGVCAYPPPVPIPYTLEPVSLPPMYHHYYQPVVRLNYRPYRTRPRTSSRHLHNGPPNSNDTAGNGGYSSLQENGWGPHSPHNGGDYASLPPTANLDNPDNRDELSSEHRRYSDPGLGPADSTIKVEDTDTETSSVTNIERNNRLFVTLVDQMTRIKETNSQLFKELHQAKSELETVKTELHHFKQNAPSDYQPGMFTDIIKEIRDANRLKEEAMLAKVKSLLDSQSSSQRLLDFEDLKVQLEKVKKGKVESEERIEKLEKEVAELRLRLSSEDHREIAAFEEENLALRRELQEARAGSKNQHANKCVVVNNGTTDDDRDNDVVVNFESHLYTSTPVRTHTKNSPPLPRCTSASPSSSLESSSLVILDPTDDDVAPPKPSPRTTYTAYI